MDTTTEKTAMTDTTTIWEKKVVLDFNLRYKMNIHESILTYINARINNKWGRVDKYPFQNSK